MLRRGPKEYRIVRDGRGGERFPWTVYGPGGSGEPLSARDYMSQDDLDWFDARGSGFNRAWNIKDRGDEQVADVFPSRRKAKQAVWLLEQGVAHVDPSAPLCWRLYQDV
jgi:hypothetical protein